MCVVSREYECASEFRLSCFRQPCPVTRNMPKCVISLINYGLNMPSRDVSAREEDRHPPPAQRDARASIPLSGLLRQTDQLQHRFRPHPRRLPYPSQP